MRRVPTAVTKALPIKCVRFNSSGIGAAVRSDWTKQQIQEIYDMPLMDLVFRASSVHRMYFNSAEVQQVKTYSYDIFFVGTFVSCCARYRDVNTYFTSTTQISARY